MHEFVFEITDYIKDHIDESMSVLDRWVEKTEADGKPRIGNPGKFMIYGQLSRKIF